MQHRRVVGSVGLDLCYHRWTRWWRCGVRLARRYLGDGNPIAPRVALGVPAGTCRSNFGVYGGAASFRGPVEWRAR